MRQGDGELAVLVCGLGLVAAGMWGYAQVKELSYAINVDVETALSVVLRCITMSVIVVTAAYHGLWRLTLPFIPCFVYMAVVPLFTYWSWNYIFPGMPLNHEQAWYGIKWLQVMIALAFGAGGVAYTMRHSY